jgi:hypothetical protein
MCRAYPLNPASYGRSKAATPGPWVRRTGTNLIEGSDGTPVHRVIVENESGESNSRLIAAAPELSRELEAIIDSATDGREIPEWLEERLVGAKAAIQKARGGQ